MQDKAVWDITNGLDNRSRMSREAHVRFRERLGVKLPRPTRHDCHNTWDTAFAEDDRPWIVASPQGTVVMMLLRRIAYNMLALYRAVTQRAEEKRRTPWKALLRWMRDMLVALDEEDLAGLRNRKTLAAFAE